MGQEHPHADRHRDGGADGGRGLVPPPGDEEVHDEDPGRELDRHRQPDQDPARHPPQQPGPWFTQVHQAREHDERVDLAEADAVTHRVQPQHRCGQGGQGERHPRSGAVDEAVPGVPDGRGGREHLQGGPQPPGGRERHQGQRDRQERRERGVGERQQLRGLGERGVDRPTGEDRDAGVAVDLDVDLPLVDRPEHEVAQDDGQRGERDERRGEQPPVPRDGAVRSGAHRTILVVRGGRAAPRPRTPSDGIRGEPERRGIRRRHRPTRSLSPCCAEPLPLRSPWRPW